MRQLVGGACFGMVGVVLTMMNYEGGGVVVLWWLVWRGRFHLNVGQVGQTEG